MFEDSVVSAIVATVADATEDSVRAVLTALEALSTGDPVGMVVQDPKTQSVAIRVSDGGVPHWRVTGLDGNVWRDMQPTLAGWTPLGGATAAPAEGKKNA